MGITERREREREALRTRIVESARDIVSEEGLEALSMRAIAERIEYSPGTIYLYFRDKDELVREVIQEGFQRMALWVQQEIEAGSPGDNPALQHRCMGRAYAKFALDNTAYFRVMFELPGVPHMDCPSDAEAHLHEFADESAWGAMVATVQGAIDAGLITIRDAQEGAVISWGLVHGLTSLYLSGHLGMAITTHDEFLSMVERAMDSLGTGWNSSETAAESGS
ncbi:TetR/AcrR family transcriptional regulator [soil metagenome]